MNQRLLDGKRFHNGAHVVPVGARDGFGDLYLETVAKSGRPTIAYCIWEHGSDKAGANPPDLRGYDPLTEAKEKYRQHSPLGEDGVLTIAREDKIWQPGMAPDEKRDLQAWEPRNHASPEAAADEYWSIIWPIIQQNPQADVWGAFNEYSNNWKWQSRFYIRLMEHANAAGVVLALGNYSSGNPPLISEEEDPERYTVFDQWLPWLDFAGKHGHIFCTHEYFDFDPDHPELHVGRFVYMYDRMIEKGITLPPLVIGEMGFVAFPGNDKFIHSMISNDILYRRHGSVLGGCAFTYGKWGSKPGANIQTASERYGKLLASTAPWSDPDPPPDPEPPTPEPEPERKYVRHVVLIPQTTTALEDAELANRYDRRVTIIRSADDAFILPGAEWPTQLVRLDVDVWGVRRIAGKLDLEEAKQALDNFIDTYHPVRETDIEFNLKYFEFATAQPPPPDQDPKPFTLRSPVPDIPFRITSPFDAKRNYGPHEGIDLDSWDDDRARAVWVYPAQEGTVHKIVPAGSGLGYGNYVILRHAGPWLDGHIYYTWYAHLEYFADLEIGQFVTFADPLGMSGKSGLGTTAIHLHLPLQDYKKDDNGNEVAMGKGGYWIPSVKDPTPLFVDEQPPTEPPPEETHVPVSMLHLAAPGLHPNDPNGSFMTDLNMLKDARMDGFVFTTNSDIDPDSLGILLQQTNIPPENVIIRLHMPGSDPNIASPAKYVELHRAWIKHGLHHGVRKFQLWNEPNLDQSMLDAGIITPDQMEWPGTAAEFASVYAQTVDLFRKEEYGNDMLIALPPMSPQENTGVYYNVLSMTDADMKADWASVHSYFSVGGSGLNGIDSVTGGLYWQNVIDLIRPDIPMWITEFADNGDGPDLDRAQRTAAYYTKQYPLRIKGLACYISQDENWPLQAWDKNPHMVGAVRDR